MNRHSIFHPIIAVFMAQFFVMCSTTGNTSVNRVKQLVRLAVIEVDSAQIEAYNDFLGEEIEASIRLEPGVITLYGVAEKKNPQHVILFETYADSAQYRAHLATPHFLKYKDGTLKMVKGLELIEMTPIIYHRKQRLPDVPQQDLYIRLIKIKIDPAAVADFQTIATDIMLPGIKEEQGVLVMYAAAVRNDPSQIFVLEVYENPDAYAAHIATPHFLKYKEDSKEYVRALELIDVDPILLGSNPD